MSFKKAILAGLLFPSLIALVSLSGGDGVKQSDTLERTLTFSGSTGERTLVIDNIFGSIKVTSHGGNDVLLVAEKTITARDEDHLADAKDEVRLAIQENSDRIRLYVDGPFRTKNGINYNGSIGYQVLYNFTLRVPRTVNLDLKTVNDGIITVENVRGNFNIRNVNGEVTLNGMDGSGSAHTVNGEVKVSFTEPPASDCSFRTVNGDLDISFPGDMTADLKCKTFNGDVYTDFETTGLPADPVTRRSKNGITRIKTSEFTNIRVGDGGPRFTFDTLNGDILIKSNNK